MKRLYFLIAALLLLSVCFAQQADTFRVKIRIPVTDSTRLRANPPIDPGTYTKITYDSKGLVVMGENASTDDIYEGYNQYFTEDRVRSTVLSGYAPGTNTVLAATDNFLTAFGKLQAQITARQAQLNGTGLVRMNGTTVSYDNSTYLTANQNITLSGDASGSGATAIAVSIPAATVTGKALTGYTVGTNTALSATDNILGAFGKVQAQINARQAQLNGTGLVRMSGTTVSYDNTSYEPAFAKSTAFNKNFGTAAGTVAEGNDSRIQNGQTAYSWGNHAGLYPTVQRLLDTATALRTGLDGKQPLGDYATNTNVATLMDAKVDKVDGMGLSEESFTTVEKAKLQGVQDGANYTKDYLVNRQNHTGYHPYSSFDPAMFEVLDVHGLQTPYTSVAQIFGSAIAYHTLRTQLWEATTTYTAVDGQVILQAVYIPKKDTLTGIKIQVTNNATFTADNNNKVALYKYNADGTLTRAAESANSASIFSSAGIKTVAFAGGAYIAEPGVYFVGFLWNNNEAVTPSPTAPTIRAATATAAEGATIDFQAGAKLSAQVNSVTDFAASYTLSSLTATGSRQWMGLYK